MINIKENKGITLVSLVVTIVIILILCITVIYNYSMSNDVSVYNKMVADIKLLEDKIVIYYNKYADTPKTNRSIEISGTEYYEIDLSKLENITLNYGQDYKKDDDLNDSSDVYLINPTNLDIYYLSGIEINGETYHVK